MTKNRMNQTEKNAEERRNECMRSVSEQNKTTSRTQNKTQNKEERSSDRTEKNRTENCKY